MGVSSKHLLASVEQSMPATTTRQRRTAVRMVIGGEDSLRKIFKALRCDETEESFIHRRNRLMEMSPVIRKS